MVDPKYKIGTLMYDRLKNEFSIIVDVVWSDRWVNDFGGSKEWLYTVFYFEALRYKEHAEDYVDWMASTFEIHDE